MSEKGTTTRAVTRDEQLDALVRLIHSPDSVRLRVLLGILLPPPGEPEGYVKREHYLADLKRVEDERDAALAARPRVEVHDYSGDGTGPFRLMVNGYGICKWPPPKDASDEEYAEESARVLKKALGVSR